MGGGSQPLYAYWSDEPVWGAWISPDWFFPGTRNYDEFDVRQTARKLMQDMHQQGINNIFLETYLRGYTIAAIPDKATGAIQPVIEGPLPPGQVPIYKHLNWHFRKENGSPVDTLQIFIEEGAPLGIKVHAWMHMLYWRMDNREIILPWHRGVTVWNGMVVDYLNSEKKRFEGQGTQSRKTISLLSDCSSLFSRTYDDYELERILDKYGVSHENGKLLGSLITYITSQGGSPPGFLLLGSPDDPFPSSKKHMLGPIYLNPENAEVQETLLNMVESITRSHKGLAGVHLDHIRFSTDYQGLPLELQQPEWDTVYFNQYNDDSMATFAKYEKIVNARRQCITGLVNKVVERVGSNVAVSCAVLPADPPMPDEKHYFYHKSDFAAQDWYRWNVDFVVPMMYNFIPWRIRQKVIKWDNDMSRIYGDNLHVRIFPGVSHLQKAQLGLLDCDTWVFFDLTLARDLKFEKKASDDFTVPKEN